MKRRVDYEWMKSCLIQAINFNTLDKLGTLHGWFTLPRLCRWQRTKKQTGDNKYGKQIAVIPFTKAS